TGSEVLAEDGGLAVPSLLGAIALAVQVLDRIAPRSCSSDDAANRFAVIDHGEVRVQIQGERLDEDLIAQGADALARLDEGQQLIAQTGSVVDAHQVRPCCLRHHISMRYVRSALRRAIPSSS